MTQTEQITTSESDTPLTVDELTVGWLNQALMPYFSEKYRAEDSIKVTPVTAFSSEIIGVGEGFMGQLARLTLDYAGSTETDGAEGVGHHLPESIIAKFAATNSATRDMAKDQGLYQREIGFYRDIGNDVGVPVAECYFLKYLEDSNHFVLLLEDMAPAIASDQVKGTSKQDSTWVIETIAKLHAKWWNSELLASYDWAQPIFNSMPMEQGLAMINEAIERAETTDAFDAYPEIKRLMKLLPPLFAMDPPPPFPNTLCHGDLRSDNVFCPTDAGGKYSLIDWQLSGVNQPANDLARWFTQSITVEQRRETEMDLLKLYHQRIVEYGVTGYSFKQLKQDYQLNLVVLLLMFSNTMDDLDKSDERSRAVLHVMYARLDVALLDWKITNLLRALPYLIPFMKLAAWFRSKF
ncbi:MAG: oxidoreductase family protein [bacterium]|nr:DUF1679 domain-containing protein [Gammaproteobacteria bacterium]